MEGLDIDKRVSADEETVFVLGNGPSLRNIDLRSLSAYSTIGLNAAYRYWREIDWRPTYYACLDVVVGISHRDEILRLVQENRIRKFLLRENLVESLNVTGGGEVVNFDALRFHSPMLQSPHVTTGSHAALWAADMGYRKIVLLGVDAQYTEVVAGARRRKGIELEVVRQEENPNYFFDEYQQPGDRFNLPNPRRGLHVNAWREAAARLSHAHVDVYNGNPSSSVRVFPFVDVGDLLDGGATLAPAAEKVSAMSAANEAASRTKRIQAFVGSHLLALVGGLVLMAAAGLFFTAAGVKFGPVLFSLLLIYPLFVLFLYTRSTVNAHLHDLEARNERLEAALKELVRWQPASGRKTEKSE